MANTPSKPIIEIRVSITVQVRNVSPTVRLKYPLNSQKPGSFTCDAITLPAPVASTIKAGSAWVTLIIGNTTPAAAMVSVFTVVPAEEAVGLGANYPSDRLHHKVAVVEQAIQTNRPDATDPLDVLAKVGGFDLVGMTGVMLGGAAAGVPVVLDGFLSYACALAACRLAPQLWQYLIPSHLSAEKGSLLALAHLDFRPFLQLGMRLGEGSGAALAMPILEAAISMYQRMGLLSEVNLDLPAPV